MRTSHSPGGTPQRAALVLAAAMGAAGSLHLARPQLYAGLIPRALGPWQPWVVGSGVAELVCAGLLAVPRTRRVGGLATAALLVAVLPGNVEMARRLRRRGGLPRALAWLRVPLQVPLVLWALRAGGFWALRAGGFGAPRAGGSAQTFAQPWESRGVGTPASRLRTSAAL